MLQTCKPVKSSPMIPRFMARKILLIGPDYQEHRGGIGAVIAVYKDQFEVFNFIPTFRPYGSNWRKTLYFIRQFIKIGIYLARNPEIRIVHIHSSKRGSLYRKLLVACLAKMIFRKKTINHIHTGNLKRFYENSNAWGKKIIAYFLRLNDVTVTVSDSLKNYCETVFHLQHVHKISNVVHYLPHEPSTVRVIKDDRVNLLFLGLIDQNKGIFDLLQVLVENKQTLSGRIKLFVGGNGQVELLQERIETDQLDDLVEYKGWVTGYEKHLLLQYADVFVLPSYYEGVPMAILEAMSYGKPVIATTVGGIPELVQPDRNGWLIRPGDRAALLNALLFYVNDRDNIGRHGARSASIVEDYSPETIMPQLDAIYRSLLTAH